MRRTLLISSAAALGAHALLLFGFSRPGVEGSSPTRPPADTLAIIVQPPIFPPEQPVRDSDDMASARPREAQSVPAQPEPFQPVVPGEITIPLPPTPPPRVDGRPVDRIPPIWAPNSASDGPDRSGGPLISPELLDNPPRTRYQAAPQYPYSAKQSGLGGEVLVAFEVDERGAVHNAAVVRSTAREFEEPTLRAVEKWRFQPGKKDGRPVRFRMVVPVVFNLNE